MLWGLNYCLCIWEEGIFVFMQLWGKKFSKPVIPVCLDLPFYHPNLPVVWQFSLLLGIYEETIKKCRCTDYLNYISISLLVNWQLLRQCDQCLKFNLGIRKAFWKVWVIYFSYSYCQFFQFHLYKYTLELPFGLHKIAFRWKEM